MKSDVMSKLSACIFVLVMALSTLVVLPAAVEGQAPGTNDILVPVLGQFSQAVPSANVTLTNVHSGQVIRAVHSGGSSLFFRAQAAPSGSYRLDVTASGYYDSLNADFFRFDGLTSNQTAPVQLDPFPTKSFSWTITLSPVKSGVTVGFYDADLRQIVAFGTTNSSGKAIIQMFDTTALGRTFYLFAKGVGVETYLEVVTVGAPDTRTIAWNPSTQVVGFVNTPSGTADHVVAYLLNKDPSIPWIKRLLKSEATFGSFTFDAYPDDFTLSIKADGVKSEVSNLTVSSTTILTKTLPLQVARAETTNIVFDDDYTSFNLTLSTTWAYDEPFPGLQYSDVGSLRMQIDMNNNSDGTVDALEDAKFRDDPATGSGMLRFGPKNVTTPWLLQLNETSSSPGVFYLSAKNLVQFNLGSTVGPVTSLASVAYSYKVNYTHIVPAGVTAPPLGSPLYNLNMNVFHDSSFVDYVFKLHLMPDFELVPPNATSDASTLIGGYHNITVDPKTGSGPISVTLPIEKALQPSSKANLDTVQGVVYPLKNETGVVIRYFVSADKNVTFNASSSSDPNDNPLTYIWEFGDGGSDFTTANKTIVHKYTSARNTTVNLTVRDVSNRTNTTHIHVTVDDLDPTPIISLRNRSLISNELRLNQSETFIIHGMNSYDDAVNATTHDGLIDHYQFVWGDGNVSGRIMFTDDQKNATWSYERAGTYILWLNVTDVTGHHKNKSLTVRVNDTTAPVVSFKVINSTWGITLVEQKKLYFDASATRDNVDNYTLMHYSWYFGDGTGASSYTNGTGKYNVTHTYAKLGSYTVTLNVTDLAEPKTNSRKLDKGITVASKPRPNLKIENVTYQPGEFTEGKQGFIIVNITNVGNAIARNITVSFYIQNLDGTQTLIGTASAQQIFNGSNQVSQVAAGGKIQVRFAYTPSGKGEFTIKVNVTSKPDQLSASEMVQSGPNALIVKQAAYKTYLLWGGVIGVIVLVPLLIYLTRRWSRRERKGPRREKKSEEE